MLLCKNDYTGFEENAQHHVLECFGSSFQIAGKYKGKIELLCEIILDVLEEVVPTFFFMLC